MQNLGSEVRQLGRFLEADDLDAAGFGADVRVGGHHAIDVGPYFDALGIQTGSDDGGGIVRAAPADRGGDSGFGGADETSHHRHTAGIDQRLHLGPQAFVGFFKQGSGFGMGAVGHQAVARIEMCGGHALGGKCRGHDLARKHFTVGGDVVGGARCQFADGGDAAQQFVEVLEISAQVGMKLSEQGGTQQLAGSVVVTLLQSAAQLERRFTISRPGRARHGQ